VTLEPTDVIALEFLAEELIKRGREGDMQRAAALFDQAFRVQIYDNRWRQAARAIGTYRRAGQPVDASRVQAQVGEDLDVAGLLSSLEHTAELDPEVAQRAVDRLCLGSIVAILGANNCLYGISASAAAALDSESPDRAGAFAAAASHGMVGMAIRNTRVIPEEPPSKFINELEVLLSKGIESAALYYDYASLVRDPERRIWALENAIRLAPEDGDAAYRLAGIYEVTGQIDKAVAQFERARMLTRPAPVPPTWRSSASAWESIVEIRLEAIEMHLARLSTSAPTVRTLGGR
jgi:tetratricopeptide (TPR) repeat protein